MVSASVAANASIRAAFRAAFAALASASAWRPVFVRALSPTVRPGRWPARAVDAAITSPRGVKLLASKPFTKTHDTNRGGNGKDRGKDRCREEPLHRLPFTYAGDTTNIGE